MRRLLFAGALAGGLLAAACSGGSPSSAGPTGGGGYGGYGNGGRGGGNTTTTAPAPRTAVHLALAKTKLGMILTDGRGRTLYLFKKDTKGVSNCSGACATAWPPVTTRGTPVAGTGLTARLAGTITRADGTMQVTYGGHPLYRFVQDRAPGDVNGQDLTAFGATWYVVGANGAQIGK
jgi:predicted lipoprotein with Yx(FWY)xxD motif